MEFFSKLFDTSDFSARWYCGQWTVGHGWLHILSDLGVWSAYFAIPAVLLYFVLQRKDLPFRNVFWLFGAFILLCGTTHLMEAIIFWWPAYRLAGVIKFVTAVVSWITVIALIKIAPKAMLMRSPEDLEREVKERTAELAEANIKLTTEREWFSTTLASIGDAVITTDMQGRVTMLNQVAEMLTGWKLEDAKGQPLPIVFNIVSEDNRQPVENPALRALSGGVIIGLANHTVLIAKDGTEWFIDDSAAPIKDATGLTAGAVLVFRDISDKYRSEKERQHLNARLDALVQNAPIGIALFDADLRFIDLNERAAAIDGMSRQDHLGKTIGELLPDMGPSIEMLLRQVRDTGKAEINVEVQGATPASPGEIRHWVASYYPVRDSQGSVLCIGAVALDITDRKRAEQRLRFQYDLTRAITDNATTAIFMMDDQSRCTFMNPAAESMTGYSFKEIENGVLHDFIHHHHPDGRPYPILECPLDRALPEKFEVHGHEDTFIRKNGEFYPVLCNVRPFYDGEKSAGTVIEALDLTQQKLAAAKLRESESQFLQLANAIPQLAWMARPDGHIDWYNNRWYDYTGTTLVQMEGWGWQSVHDPEALPQVIERWKASIRTGQPFDMVFPLRGADGVFRPFLTRVVPFLDDEGKVLRWFGTNTDISEQQEIQEELRDVAARLSEADRRKDEFLAMLAHELRNPLAPIRNAVQVLRLTGSNGEAVQSASEMMERQLAQLVRLVDDLLDVSRISRGKIELRRARVELASVVNDAVEAASALVQCMEHDLVVKLPPMPIYLYADPTRLTQVVGNLLNNACKFTNKGGSISLIVERDGEQAVIRLRDTGIGIAADQLPHIFDMFMQVDSSLERSVSGLGIGLTLVKNLVEMHGGTVEVHSVGIGHGSEFVVRLPIITESAKSLSPEPTAVESTPTKGRRILVVDDNRDAASSLAMLLRITGNQTHTAFDGLEAVEAAETFKPDLVLMDIGLPKLNGYEACRKIREQPWGGGIRLVALTGWGQEEDRQKSRDAGFNDHLVKPVDFDALTRLLSDLDVDKG